MNEFTKQWITSTLAPESIVNIKSSDKGYLDVVRNESNTIQVIVLSTNNHIQAIGFTYDEILTSKSYSFKDGLHKIAELLKIESVSL